MKRQGKKTAPGCPGAVCIAVLQGLTFPDYSIASYSGRVRNSG